MSDFRLSKPVAFMVFNRPDTTGRVFEEIRRARPPRLLVVADGPRPGRPEDAEKCSRVREIIDSVDWDCEILRNYADENMGCRTRMSSGLDWVFHTVEEAIILEDDCLPHPTFFRYCQELLNKYRDDERISIINGSNFQFGKNSTEYSYYFSCYQLIWGWASWRRSWKMNDVNMSLWPKVRDGKWLEEILDIRRARKHWTRMFEKVYQNEIDTWDFQWVFSCWINGLLSITPCENLVSNIGFAPDALHTRGNSPLASIPTREMEFPLKHPEFQIRNREADSFTERTAFSKPYYMKVIRGLKSRLGRLTHPATGPERKS